MKLLLVKLGAVGDSVMVLEALARIRGVEVTWISGKTIAPLVAASGLAKEQIVVDDARFYKGTAAQRVSEILKVWQKLRFRRFDACFIGYRDSRYRVLTLPAIFRRVTFFHPTPKKFHTDEIFLTLQKLLDNPSSSPEAKVPGFPRRRPEGKFIVAIAPGGAKNILRDDALRRWPVENYHKLAAALLEAGCEVIYTGSSEDAWVREGMPRGVNDEIGKYDLVGLVERFSACHLVVTHDSGPMHLARLAGAPVVAIFGPTIPSEKVPPETKVLWGGAGLACWPCYNGQTYADCADNQCIKQITVTAVVNAVTELRGKL